MTTEQLVAAINDEISRLQRVRSLLSADLSVTKASSTEEQRRIWRENKARQRARSQA